MKKNSAFTLIEILLALALLALVTTLVVLNANALLTGFDDKPLPAILQRAVREARFLAAKNKESTFLTFDPESSSFIIRDMRKTALESFPIGYEPKDSSLQINFFQIMPESGIMYTHAFALNRKSTPRITFHPDRSSTPFMVKLKYKLEESTHYYDPFSDAELKDASP